MSKKERDSLNSSKYEKGLQNLVSVFSNIDFFQQVETQEYVVWADCGNTFGNNEFVGYLLLELAQLKIHGI